MKLWLIIDGKVKGMTPEEIIAEFGHADMPTYRRGKIYDNHGNPWLQKPKSKAEALRWIAIDIIDNDHSWFWDKEDAEACIREEE